MSLLPPGPTYKRGGPFNIGRCIYCYYDPCRCQQWNTAKVEPEFQHYWRCAHHPSALLNFQDGRTTCEWHCHAQELKWYHCGVHPMPKSWGKETIIGV